MLDSYEVLPCMFAAKLVRGGQLTITEVTAHIYKRIGTAGLGRTKQEAIELLRRREMDKFEHIMKCINWQAQQY